MSDSDEQCEEDWFEVIARKCEMCKELQPTPFQIAPCLHYGCYQCIEDSNHVCQFCNGNFTSTMDGYIATESSCLDVGDWAPIFYKLGIRIDKLQTIKFRHSKAGLSEKNASKYEGKMKALLEYYESKKEEFTDYRTRCQALGIFEQSEEIRNHIHFYILSAKRILDDHRHLIYEQDSKLKLQLKQFFKQSEIKPKITLAEAKDIFPKMVTQVDNYFKAWNTCVVTTQSIQDGILQLNFFEEEKLVQERCVDMIDGEMPRCCFFNYPILTLAYFKARKNAFNEIAFKFINWNPYKDSIESSQILYKFSSIVTAVYFFNSHTCLLRLVTGGYTLHDINLKKDFGEILRAQDLHDNEVTQRFVPVRFGIINTDLMYILFSGFQAHILCILTCDLIPLTYSKLRITGDIDVFQCFSYTNTMILFLTNEKIYAYEIDTFSICSTPVPSKHELLLVKDTDGNKYLYENHPKNGYWKINVTR
jgi:hypothetical protein